MRKLATVRKIDDLRPIEGADAIECAVIGGWTVVVKKGEFTVGDLAVYFEIDSWVPTTLAPFLSKGKEPREYGGVKGERLKTIRLRGQLSQGLLLPLGIGVYDVHAELGEGTDVSELLNIQKWEAPVPAQLAGEVKGMFPGFIPKTDQERIQNLKQEVAQWTKEGLDFEVTEKLDGSSMTVYVNGDEFGVCSRNLDLRESEYNTFWKVARDHGLIDKAKSIGRNIALQGELIGEGIQKNPYKIKGHAFYLFDVYDIDEKAYWAPWERQFIACHLDINHVPVLPGCGDKDLGTGDVQDILLWAEDKSILCSTAEREGIVFKCNEDPSLSFKAISNKFLLRGD